MKAPTKAARWRRWLAEAALFGAIVFGVHLWQTRALPTGPAPAFTGVTTAGHPVTLATALAAAGDRPLLVYFWATWCPVCKIEEDAVAGVATDWPVVAVAMQSGGTAEVARHLAERGVSLPAVVDADGAIAARWGVRGVPTLFVVDPAGRIRFVSVGYTSGVGLRLRLWWARHFSSRI